ncbi:exoribonuclease R [Glutamicibacter uratoxydans]|uniref:Exoribonuclease R n=1 Tax=Glutamicibacter uratoxydans TaxID=43667 RepID=A0A4Y4DV18_GLUUR|nr:RNB domain-containing ribonuclease [Glutamicibacter uratoxydans]GED07704.1 exoribonuclease R [Glutamicibacter uratoxydans]
MIDRSILSPQPLPTADLAQLLSELETEFSVPADFSPEVLAAAEQAVLDLGEPELDDTNIPFFTIDPLGATDLDQAMYLERVDTGYLVHYAIADVPAFVHLGSLLDEISRQRGQTYYLPQRKITLYPPLISEDRGSLLPEQVRRAFHWKIWLDHEGSLGKVELTRTKIRSRAQLDYEGAQAGFDAHDGDAQLKLLAEIGTSRLTQERLRGGASLNLPDQEIVPDGQGYKLVSRTPLPLEEFNAQISLVTGIGAARLMLGAGFGILRTMPAPDPKDQQAFREQTRLLGCPWPQDLSYGEFLHTLDLRDPRQLVIMHRAASLFRGADYQIINGQPESELIQAALAAPYAHTTAPLRRLIDRFVLLTCHLISTGAPIPDELHTALEQLPELMRASSTAANRVSKAAVDLLEAYTMQHRIGEEFEAIVLQASHDAPDKDPGNNKTKPGTLQLMTEPITGSFSGPGQPGTVVSVKLVLADPKKRKIHFEVVASN